MDFDLNKMQQMLSQARDMQQQMDERSPHTTVEGSSGGGAVTVRMNGKKELLKLTIAPSAASAAAGDITMLEDLILAAVNEASRKADDAPEIHHRPTCSAASASPASNVFSTLYPLRSTLCLMAQRFAEPMARLIDELRKLPGVGTKSAQRFAFHVLRSSEQRRRRPRRRHPHAQKAAPPLLALQQHHRRRPLRLLHRPHPQPAPHLHR